MLKLENLMIKTKIIATVGPACDSPAMIEEMIKAGVSIFRFNTKHGTLKWHADRINRVRKTAGDLKHPIAIMLDLKGSELRVGNFKYGQIQLKKGQVVNIVSKSKNSEDNIVLPELTSVKGIKKDSVIYLDDGFLELKVLKSSFFKIKAEVVEGGVLKNNKGINFPTARIDLPSLLKKDLEFISLPSKKDIDYFSYSFVRSKKDILELRKILKKQGLKAKIIAKIENRKSIENFEEILNVSDGIMVARGDLGIEVALEKVPYYQKMIITKCREQSKPVIVATQMLESMIKKPRPTRAEAADVANAVYDSTDSLMLSGETAGGDFPVKAIKIMARIAGFAEEKSQAPKIIFHPKNLTELITFSAFKIAENSFLDEKTGKLKIRYFIVFTDTGATARYLSRLRPSIPILAITQDKQVRDQLSLSFGVQAFCYKFPHGKIRSTRFGLEFLKKKRMVKKGEQTIVIYGKQWGIPGQTNTVRVEKIS